MGGGVQEGNPAAAKFLTGVPPAIVLRLTRFVDSQDGKTMGYAEKTPSHPAKPVSQ